VSARSSSSNSRIEAVSFLPCLSAQWHMLLRGARNARPALLRAYSTASGLEFVTRLTIRPLDSRLRSVLVNMRWETPFSLRRSSAWRFGPCFRAYIIITVHLPMKRAGLPSDALRGLPFPISLAVPRYLRVYALAAYEP